MKFITTLLFCIISIFSNAQNWFPVGSGINLGGAELYSFEEKLFVGGIFDTIDGALARGLAYWDDKKWKSFFIDGLPYRSVSTFVTYNDELYAYGRYGNLYDPSYIIKYDKLENTWINVPNSEISLQGSSGQFTSGQIFNAIEFQNELYVAGDFDYISDKPIKNIAKWNGIEWVEIPSNLGAGLHINRVTSFEIFNNELIISTSVEYENNENWETDYRVLRWNGEAWSDLGNNLITDSTVFSFFNIYELEEYQGELYAAGTRIKIVGDDQHYSLIKWDGNQWKGINGFNSNNTQLIALKKFSTYLAIGGEFFNFSENNSDGVTYLYNGNTIKEIEGDFSLSIRNFAELNKQLFVGTNIDSDTISNDVGIYRLGKFNLDEDSNSKCNFFPNPTEGEFMITYEAKENTSTTIRFYTISGILVHEEIFNDLKGPYLRRFNLQDFHTGAYIVQIQSRGVNESKIIMKN